MAQRDEHKRNFTELTHVREVWQEHASCVIQSPRQKARNEHACVSGHVSREAKSLQKTLENLEHSESLC